MSVNAIWSRSSQLSRKKVIFSFASILPNSFPYHSLALSLRVRGRRLVAVLTVVPEKGDLQHRPFVSVGAVWSRSSQLSQKKVIFKFASILPNSSPYCSLTSSLRVCGRRLVTGIAVVPEKGDLQVCLNPSKLFSILFPDIVPSCLWTPFGHGHRRCPGKR
ncbi:hypothetical protein K438DRAFT_1954804 [Mycena galopus ATCC 62051]|nr:hypothetical protein K438DRAFT_1954804 [Mycena galopus ATCC 62051]